MLNNGIRFFATVFLSVFAFVAESVKRILFAWASVDRLACVLAVAMVIGAFILDSSFCGWVAVGAVTCLSAAAWRGERWNLNRDGKIASDRFRRGWDESRRNVAPGVSKDSSPRTTFAGADGTPRRELSVDALKPKFTERIVGQSHAQDLVLAKLASLLLGTRPRTKAPLSFLFVGPTGTGKGELASLIAEVMGRSVAKFNMGEYNNDQTLWTLLGSPKGYANPEEGLLTRAVRNDPRTVLFFDEIEKGHPRIIDIFLSTRSERATPFGREEVLNTGSIQDVPAAGRQMRFPLCLP